MDATNSVVPAVFQRTVQVLEVAYTTAALKAAHPNAELGQVIDGLYPGFSHEVRREGVQVGTEGSFAQCLARTLSPYLPNGVDPQQVAPIFKTCNILDQVNVVVKGNDWDSPIREITYTRPSRELEALFQEINRVPGRQQNGISPHNRVMAGFKRDVVPAKSVEKTVFVNFDIVNRTRAEEKAELEKRDQEHVQPGGLALPLAVQLAKYGWNHEKGNLLRYQGNNFVARTEMAGTKNHWPVWDLSSDADGVHDVCGDFYGGGYDDPDVVAAGSSNHKP